MILPLGERSRHRGRGGRGGPRPWSEAASLLPESDRPRILARIRGAWALKDAKQAETQLEALAAELERSWPDAAGSLREGLAETLTLLRLGITGNVAKTLSSRTPSSP